MHLFSYLATSPIVYEICPNTWRRDPLSLNKMRKSLRGKLNFLEPSFQLVLMRHTVPQPPNVDLGKIWLPQFKTREKLSNICSSLFSFGVWGVPYVHFGHLPIGNQWRLKRFCFNKWNPQPKINLSSIISLPFPRKNPKMSWQTTLRWRKLRQKGGGIGMMYLVDVPKMPQIYRISSIWNWLDRFLWQAKWGTPQKSAFSGILAF